MSEKKAEQGGTQPNPPSPEVDKTLTDLETRATESAPGAGDQEQAPGTGTENPTPEPEYVPKGPPLPEGFDRDRPWGIWIQAGDKIVQKVVNNWDFKSPVEIEGNQVDGHMLYIWGTEAWLTKVLPNGIIDLEKYPLVVALIGFGLICLNNIEAVIDAKGNEKYRLKPIRKAIAKPETKEAGAGAKVGGEDLETRGNKP